MMVTRKWRKWDRWRERVKAGVEDETRRKLTQENEAKATERLIEEEEEVEEVEEKEEEEEEKGEEDGEEEGEEEVDGKEEEGVYTEEAEAEDTQ